MRKENTGFAFDVLTMVTGTTVSQLLSSLTVPIIARLFAPDAFGILALFSSITATIGVVTCLKYECSVLLPERDNDAANALGLSFCLVVVTSSLTGALAWLLRRRIIHWLNAPALEAYLWLVPVAVFIAGVYLVLINWATRKKQFKQITIAQFLSTFGTAGTQIGLGLSGNISGGGLIVGSLSGVFVATLFLGTSVMRESGHLLRGVQWSQMVFALKRYQRFAKFGTPAGILNTISWQLPAFLLSAYFSTAVVGQYSLGYRLLGVPMNLIGLNIGRVFLQRAAQARLEGSLRDSVENAFRYLVVLSIFPSLMLGLVGKDIFVTIFGQRWAAAGVYAQILSVWVCFWFISSPLSVTLIALEEQALELRMQYLIFGSRLASLVAGGLLGSPIVALGLFSGTGAIVYGTYSYVILKRCGVSVKQMSRVLAQHVMMFLPAALIILLLKYFAVPSGAIVLAAVALTTIYFANLVYTDPAARGLVYTLIHRVLPQSANPGA